MKLDSQAGQTGIGEVTVDKRIVKLVYRPALGDTPYIVTGTVNTLQVKVGDCLAEEGVKVLITEGCEVRVSA